MIVHKIKEVSKVRYNFLLLTNLTTLSLLVSVLYLRGSGTAQLLGVAAGGQPTHRAQDGDSGSYAGGSKISSSSSSDTQSSTGSNNSSNSDGGSQSSAMSTSGAAGGWADVMAAAAAAGLQRAAPQLGERSARWAPFVVPTCVEGMPRHWAPCRVGAPGEPVALAHGEELVYPDFSIPEPLFMTDEHRDWWRAQSVHGLRSYLFEGRAYFELQHAQTLVFKNVQFNNNPPGGWSEAACMAEAVSHRGLEPLPAGTVPQLQRAVLANTPDAYSLQHFLDRVTKVLLQSEPWRTPDTVAVSSPPESPLMQDMWAALMGTPGSDGGNVTGASNTSSASASQQQPQSLAHFSAAELVFACRCPMIHPYFHARLQEVLRLPTPAPLVQRSTVLYLSRGAGAGQIRNQERRVLNEAQVLEELRGVLARRGRGEELEVYNTARFPTLQALAAYLAANVSAVVGPHGGAFYNAMFLSAPDTLLVEFLPMSRFGILVWEEASMAGRKVAVLPTPGANGQHDMQVDASLAAAALERHLGTVWDQPEPRLEYAWDLTQLSKKRRRRRR